MKIQKLFIAGIAIGILSFAFSLILDPSRAWHGYLMNYYFFVMIGLGGVFFSATQYLTNAGWSATIRRIPEALSSWLVPAIVLFIPLIPATLRW